MSWLTEGRNGGNADQPLHTLAGGVLIEFWALGDRARGMTPAVAPTCSSGLWIDTRSWAGEGKVSHSEAQIKRVFDLLASAYTDGQSDVRQHHTLHRDDLRVPSVLHHLVLVRALIMAAPESGDVGPFRTLHLGGVECLSRPVRPTELRVRVAAGHLAADSTSLFWYIAELVAQNPYPGLPSPAVALPRAVLGPTRLAPRQAIQTLFPPDFPGMAPTATPMPPARPTTPPPFPASPEHQADPLPGPTDFGSFVTLPGAPGGALPRPMLHGEQGDTQGGDQGGQVEQRLAALYALDPAFWAQVSGALDRPPDQGDRAWSGE